MKQPILILNLANPLRKKVAFLFIFSLLNNLILILENLFVFFLRVDLKIAISSCINAGFTVVFP